MRANPLLSTLRQGRPALAAWTSLADPMVTELFARIGFDAVMIDQEHAPRDLRETAQHLMAVRAYPAAGLVRVPGHDPVAIKRALDIGAEGIMVPTVETPEQAAAVVAATRYPPAGLRGAATPMIRASDYGLAEAAYIDRVDDDILVMCQIETPAGVEAVPDIARVPGVHMLVPGPNDLSACIDRFGRYDDPAFAALMARLERAVTDAGLWLGGFTFQGRTPAEMLDRGYDMVFSTIDMLALRKAAAGDLAAFRAGTAPPAAVR